MNSTSPALLAPSWSTRSASRKPGRVSSQTAYVRIGIWCLSNVTGLVVPQPRFGQPARAGPRARSIVPAHPAHPHQQFGGDVRGQRVAGRELRQPLRAGPVGDLAADPQPPHLGRAIQPPPLPPWLQPGRPRVSQHPAGIDPVTPGRRDELVQDPPLLRLRCAAAARPERVGVPAHGAPSHTPAPPFEKIPRAATISPRRRFSLRQFGLLTMGNEQPTISAASRRRLASRRDMLGRSRCLDAG